MLHPFPKTPWHKTARAVRLLAECVANPPAAQEHSTIYVLTRDEWTTYVGPQADALRTIHDEHALAILRACDASGDYTALSRFHSQPTVEQAIDAALDRAERDAAMKAAA